MPNTYETQAKGMKNLKDQDLELRNAGSESLENQPPTIKKNKKKGKKHIKKDKKAKEVDMDLGHVDGHNFKGYNLFELNIPAGAFPQKTKPNLGAHGYTLTAPNTAALCLQV